MGDDCFLKFFNTAIHKHLEKNRLALNLVYVGIFGYACLCVFLREITT